MVVGGWISGDPISNVEIISLQSPHLCRKPKDFPLEIHSTVGAFIGGQALVCGGRKRESTGHQDYVSTSSCYAYSFATDEWIKANFSLTEERGYATSALLPDGTFMVLGGWPVAKTSEILVNGEFVPGPSIPSGIASGLGRRSCLCTVNETHLFISGGQDSGSPETGRNESGRKTQKRNKKESGRKNHD